jgi:DNA/RNA-binding domain of Phe-tRNA-synthetase-like protein
MAVFGVAPAFVRVSIRLTEVEPARAADQALALLARAGAAARADPARPIGADGLRPGAAAPDGWSDAYRALGFPPDVVSPHAALRAWAATPAGLPSQGPVLDLVNAFSLREGAPTAAYDLAAVVGDLWLRPSRGIELHQPLGVGGPLTPDLAELVLADSADQVLARHWHGAPGRPFLPTAKTRSAQVHLDLLGPLAERAAALADALARLLTAYLGGSAAVRFLDRARPWAEWPA